MSWCEIVSTPITFLIWLIPYPIRESCNLIHPTPPTPFHPRYSITVVSVVSTPITFLIWLIPLPIRKSRNPIYHPHHSTLSLSRRPWYGKSHTTLSHHLKILITFLMQNQLTPVHTIQHLLTPNSHHPTPQFRFCSIWHHLTPSHTNLLHQVTTLTQRNPNSTRTLPPPLFKTNKCDQHIPRY